MESVGIDMKVFGYQKNSEVMIELEEVSIQANIKELNKIIKFLENVKKTHRKVAFEEGICHSHFRDWDVEWKHGSVDIIVATSSNVE